MESITGFALMLSSVGGVCWGAWRYGINPILRKDKKKKQALYDNIDFITNEMKVDGNGSMKTAILNLKTTTDNIVVRLDSIEGNQKIYMDLQGVAFWISNESGECIHASPGLCKLMERSEFEIKGNNWMTWVHPEDKERVFEAWEISVTKMSSFDEIYRIKRSSGIWVKVWAVAFPQATQSNMFGGKIGKMVLIEEPAT